MTSQQAIKKLTPKKADQKLFTCSHCGCTMLHRFASSHLVDCTAENPADISQIYKFTYPVYADNVLYCQPIVAEVPDDVNNLSYWMKTHLLLLNAQTMRMCSFAIGDYLVLSNSTNKYDVAVAWPWEEANALDIARSRLFNIIPEGRLKIEKAIYTTASSVKLSTTRWEFIFETSVFWQYCKDVLLTAVVAQGQQVKIPYYAAIYFFEVTIGKDDELSSSFDSMTVSEQGDAVPRLYSFSSETRVQVCRANEELYAPTSLASLKGFHQAKSKLNRYVVYPMKLFCGGKISVDDLPVRTLLLYGVSGCGKTLLCETLARELKAKLVKVLPSVLESSVDVVSVGCVNLILFDNLHYYRGTHIELAMKFLQFVHHHHEPVITIGVCERPEELSRNLRRHFDVEIEIDIPNIGERLDILKRLMTLYPHQVDDDCFVNVANSTHGCTPLDLKQIVTEARCSLYALWVEEKNNNKLLDNSMLVEASRKVAPSAMREITLEVPEVRWSDIGGQEGLKRKLREMIEWPLKHAESFRRLSIKSATGILMYGPPGCSKTMIAKAMATECELNFISIKGPELFSKYVGDSEMAVRAVFRKARQVAPSIIFFDEIDALASQRSQEQLGVANRVLAQMLTEMDGIEPLNKVIVVAATNRPDMIDQALLRPGRLDRIVYVPLPDADTRREIIAIRLKRMPVDHDVNLETLTSRTDRYSGAEVSAVCDEAAILAMEEDVNIPSVCWRHFDAALQLVVPGTSAKLLGIYERFGKRII